MLRPHWGRGAALKCPLKGCIFKEAFLAELDKIRSTDEGEEDEDAMDEPTRWHDLVEQVAQEVYGLLHSLLEIDGHAANSSGADIQVKDISPVLCKLKNADIRAEVSAIKCAPLLRDIASGNVTLVAAIHEALQTLQYTELVRDFITACQSTAAVRADDEDYVFIQSLEKTDEVCLKDVASKFGRLRTLFEGISVESGHLFSVITKVENLIAFFREHDFHSEEGKVRFDDIVSRITTTCSHDRFLSDLIDAVLIDCHPQLAPFIKKDQACQDILGAVKQLQNITNAAARIQLASPPQLYNINIYTQ